MKKFICSLFLIFYFLINGKSLADTVNVNSDTTIDSLYLDSDIKEDTTYNITNNAVYTLDGEIEANGYDLTKQGNGTFVLNASSSNFFIFQYFQYRRWFSRNWKQWILWKCKQ